MSIAGTSKNAAYAIGTDATWAYWVKPDFTTGQAYEQTIISCYNNATNKGWFVGLGEMHLGDSSSNTLKTYDLPSAGSWSFVVHVLTGGSLYTHINNTLTNTETYAQNIK
jgi:hypothetical protein